MYIAPRKRRRFGSGPRFSRRCGSTPERQDQGGDMTTRSVIATVSIGAGLLAATIAYAAGKAPAAKGYDAEIAKSAQSMLEEGKKTFRYDTFGSEAFWGDALGLHKAIAGEKNGGVGGGVSPETALAVGLKVDADALPEALKKQIKAGKGNLKDAATTVAPPKLKPE